MKNDTTTATEVLDLGPFLDFIFWFHFLQIWLFGSFINQIIDEVKMVNKIKFNRVRSMIELQQINQIVVRKGSSEEEFIVFEIK